MAKHEIHTRLKVSKQQAAEALAGAFDYIVLDFAGLGVDTGKMQATLSGYCYDLLWSASDHSLGRLSEVLDASH